MGAMTEDELVQLLESTFEEDLVQLIREASNEKGILDLKIRTLKLESSRLKEKIEFLSGLRNRKILEAMEQKGAVAEQVATEYGVSRGWIWKLQHP
jgi:hypothetical protein